MKKLNSVDQSIDFQNSIKLLFFFFFRMAIEEQRATMQAVQHELKKEKNQVKKLKTALEQERIKATTKERELESMRIKYEKALNNEMMLKMELDENPRENDVESNECSAPCSLQSHEDDMAAVPVVSVNESVETTAFYTELTIRVRKKK